MSAEARRPLVVIIGMGETGVLTAVHLKGCDIVGVATKPALVSGQELGLRLVAPRAWKRNYLTKLSRFKGLKRVKILVGRVVGVELEDNRLHVELAGGGLHVQPYDYLVIASGITNGFWRNDEFLDVAELENDLQVRSAQIARAETVAIVGGGATGTSVAANLAIRYKNKNIDLFHTGDLPLPGYPENVRLEIARLLDEVGVHRRPNHRALLEAGRRTADLEGGTIRWETGQPPHSADVILWATGATHPNSRFLPSAILDEKGFVLTEPTLQVRGWSNVFAIGDVALTDQHRSSARNWAYHILTENIQALSAAYPLELKTFKAPQYRWGSILGPQKDGLMIYLPSGGKYRMSRWYVRLILFPFKVKRQIFRGVKAFSFSS